MTEHIVSTVPLPRDRELRFTLTEKRGVRHLEVRVFSAPFSPALVRSPERDGLSVPLDSVPAMVKALKAVKAAGETGGANV